MKPKARKSGATRTGSAAVQASGAAMLSRAAWSEFVRSLRLSRRELQITRAVFDNLTEGAIGASLGVSEHTIHRHLNRLFQKLRVTTRSQVVLRVVHELMLLTLSEGSGLPPSAATGPMAAVHCKIEAQPVGRPLG